MVETTYKKIQRIIRNCYYRVNYALFRAFRGFHSLKPLPKGIKHILIVETTFIGDLLVATPTFHRLKQLYPKATIDLLMLNKFREVIENNPDISEIIGVEKEPSLTNRKEFFQLLTEIKSKKYDMGIIMHHGTIANSLLLLLAKIQYRLGCVKAGLLKGKGIFLTHKLMPHLGDQNVVLQNLHILSLITKDYLPKEPIPLQMHPSKQDNEWVNTFFKKNNISKEKPIIAIHSGTRHPSHEWFNDRFASIADWLIEEYGAQIIFTGDNYDYEHFVQHIMKQMSHKSTYAKTTIKQCNALLRQCDLLFSIDTSMIHIGAAAGIPVLGLYGSGKPTSWAPWGKQHRVIFNEHVPCTGCRKTHCTRPDYICMSSISVPQVKKELQFMLKAVKKVGKLWK